MVSRKTLIKKEQRYLDRFHLLVRPGNEMLSATLPVNGSTRGIVGGILTGLSDPVSLVRISGE
jgi:hypothetical protein